MSETTPWYQRGYMKMVSVHPEGSDLVVDFADGSRACVEAKTLLPPDTDPVEWDRLTWSPYEIAVPNAYEVVVIPSERVRMLTDKDYSQYLARAAEEQARRVGARIRELRKARGMTGKELAERAGIMPQSLSRIEHGKAAVVLPTVQRLLAAMGCSIHDLVEPDEAPAPPERALSS
jgi:DNA-binding Xre family transcriptional regulator